MRKILCVAIACLLLGVGIPQAQSDSLATGPYNLSSICGNPSQYRVQYYVTGAPITVTNPIAAQADTSLLLDLGGSPVGGPYNLALWAQISCNGGGAWQTGPAERFEYWVPSTGNWTYANFDMQGDLNVGSGTGKVAPASGATGWVQVVAPVLECLPSFVNLTTALGSSPSAATIELGYGLFGPNNWSITATPGWLGVTPASGAGEALLSVSANNAALMAPGIHAGAITVTSPQASNSPFVVSVGLVVNGVPVLFGTTGVLITGRLYFGANKVLFNASAVAMSAVPQIY